MGELSERRAAGPARMGRHRASDRRATRPRARTGSHGDTARIPRSSLAVRAGGARPGRQTALVPRPAVSPAPVAAGPARSPARANSARARVAALSHGAALRSRCVHGGTVDRGERGAARVRVAGARRRPTPPHPAPGLRTDDSTSPVRRAHAARAAAPFGTAGVPGGFLHRRAGGIVPPPSRGGRAGLRDVQHRGILQRRDVSPGRVRRPPAAALPGGDPSRPLRGRNRTGRRSPHFVPHPPEHALAVVAGESAAWYQGKRGFLSPVAIVPGLVPSQVEGPAPSDVEGPSA